MYEQFKSAGLIDGDTPWEDLTTEERNADLHRQEQRHEIGFKPLRADDSFVSSFSAESNAG